MSVRLVIKALATGLARYLYALLPCPEISRPVFIIGCGRSGTTILGETLSRHPQIAYLNEPRHLWLYAYPQTDIWAGASGAAKLLLTEADAEPSRSRIIRRLLRFEALIKGRPLLLEKLPAHCFHLGFLLRIFPAARFIHLRRNGLEVARSIAIVAEHGNWHGEDGHKWTLLAQYAQESEKTRGLPALCRSSVDQGLLEWRLSTEAALQGLQGLPKETVFELDYEDLLGRPAETLAAIQAFLGLEDAPEVGRFALASIARKSPKLGLDAVAESDRLIGGERLAGSIKQETGRADA